MAPRPEWPEGVRRIWIAVFDYTNEECGASKRQARNIADATVESMQTHIVMLGDTGYKLLAKAPNRVVKKSKPKKEES